MDHQFTILPTDKSLGGRPWKLLLDPPRMRCRILRDTGELHDQMDFRAIPSRLKLPEFAGKHRWPIITFDGKPLEFKVDRECLKFLEMLTAACLALDGGKDLDKAIRFKFLSVAIGLVLMIAVTPASIWVFLDAAAEHKSYWFGLTAGVFCGGLILVVNSFRQIGLLRKAREFQRSMQVRQSLPLDEKNRAADGRRSDPRGL